MVTIIVTCIIFINSAYAIHAQLSISEACVHNVFVSSVLSLVTDQLPKNKAENKADAKLGSMLMLPNLASALFSLNINQLFHLY